MRTQSYRDPAKWVNIGNDTSAMDVPGGMLMRVDDTAMNEHGDAGAIAMSVVFVPGATVAQMLAMLPERTVTICEDGDPPCGDAECERKHAEGSGTDGR